MKLKLPLPIVAGVLALAAVFGTKAMSQPKTFTDRMQGMQEEPVTPPSAPNTTIRTKDADNTVIHTIKPKF